MANNRAVARRKIFIVILAIGLPVAITLTVVMIYVVSTVKTAWEAYHAGFDEVIEAEYEPLIDDGSLKEVNSTWYERRYEGAIAGQPILLVITIGNGKQMSRTRTTLEAHFSPPLRRGVELTATSDREGDFDTRFQTDTEMSERISPEFKNDAVEFLDAFPGDITLRDTAVTWVSEQVEFDGEGGDMIRQFADLGVSWKDALDSDD